MEDGTKARRRALLAAAGAALSATLPGIAMSQVRPDPEWDQVVAAARKEGRVTLYTSQFTPVVTRFQEAWKKAYPDITLETIRVPTGPLISRIEQERTTGADGCDVFISPETLWYLGRAKEGGLLKLAGPAAKAWPAKYLAQGAIATVSFDPFVIAYSKTLVTAAPKSYADLLKPEFKGKIGVPELVSTTITGWWEWVERTTGNDWLVKLKAQNPKFYTSSTQLNQAIVSGEVVASPYAIAASTKPLMEQGAPIDFALPNPGFAFAYEMAVLGWAKRPNAGLLLANYVMSAEGQAVWHGKGESASPLPNVRGAIPSLGIDLWDPAKYPPDVIDKYKAHWTRVMT